MAKKWYPVEDIISCIEYGCSTEPQNLSTSKRLQIEYLYLDLITCDRCIGTDVVLKEVIDMLRPVLSMAGYEVDYKECEMTTVQIAEQYQFLSSPTIRVNGQDIFGDIKESDCGCCGEIAGSDINCRVFEYEGKVYEIPTKEILINAILKNIYAESSCACAPYVMPDNLKRFYEGKNHNSHSSCNCGCKEKSAISVFQKYLSVWVILCMVIGVLIGKFLPQIPDFLNRFEYAKVSIPMAILIWLMIYPMMMKVDFQSIKNVGKNPKGLFITWITNWLIKPFTMYSIASLFFFVIFKAFITPDLATEYLAGAVLLGAAPCTAMVFVWSSLTKGDPAYTVVQVATNDLIILVAFIPIVKFLLGVSNVSVPWDTLILSVMLFVVIPLAGGMLTRYFVTEKKGKDYFENIFVKKFDGITTIGLLLTLIIIFSFQGNVILENPLHIVLIAIPLVLQTFLIFAIAYGACKFLKLPHKIAAPAGMIGASNFFELAVAVAVALFGTTSPAALATTVGVLTEVPVMLFLVKVANSTKEWFKND